MKQLVEILLYLGLRRQVEALATVILIAAVVRVVLVEAPARLRVTPCPVAPQQVLHWVRIPVQYTAMLVGVRLTPELLAQRQLVVEEELEQLVLMKTVIILMVEMVE
jgi:hypothetical protein